MDPKELRGLMEAYSEVYAPQERIEEAEQWIQKAIKKPGALHKQLGVPEGEKISAGKLAAAVKKGGKLGQRARLAQTLKGLKEEEVQVDEAVKGADSGMRAAAAAERRAGDKPLSKKVGDANAAHMARKVRFADKVTKAKGHMPGYTYGEEVDIFDVVLEFLQAEGYAETLEEAEWLMANVIDEEAIGIILGEAEIMKFQKEKGDIEARMDSNKRRRSKTSAYFTPPTKGAHGADYRRRHNIAPTKLRSGSLPEEFVD